MSRKNRDDDILQRHRPFRDGVKEQSVLRPSFIQKKGNAPVRYDEAFKEGAIRLVNEQKRPIREVASELGICPDTLKAWLKRAGISPVSLREDKQANRLKELENEVKSLKKKLAEKDEAIDILKKSVGIFFTP